MKVSIKANKLEASSNNVRGLCTVTFGDCFAVRNITLWRDMFHSKMPAIIT